MTDSWAERSQYGEILKGIIKDLEKKYYEDRPNYNKERLAHTVAYLIQTLSSLITAEKMVESRITELEKIAGITKKGVINK